MWNAILALLFCMAPAMAAGLSEAERRALSDHLEQSSRAFLASVEGLTEAQWNYKAAPERWSIAECAEHIALAEDFLRNTVENQVLASEPSPSSDQAAELDQKVLAMITDRSFQAQAPEPLVPSSKFESPLAIVKHFEQSRQKTAAFASARDDLREHSTAHPAFEKLDAYQWILFLSGHTMRHTAQIREVKADAGFPK